MRHRIQSCSLNYIEGLFADEDDPLLEKVRLQFSDKRKLIQISPLEGKILYMLIKMNSIRNVVEVGTLAGYSTLWMAKAIPDDGIIYTIEKDEEHAMLAEQNFSEYQRRNVTLLKGDGLIELNKLSKTYQGQFDMIFIDANKAGYCDYLNWAEDNIKKNGLIIADNTLLFDTVFLEKPTRNVSLKSWRVMKKFNKRISDVEKYNSIILPTAEGLAVTIKK